MRRSLIALTVLLLIASVLRADDYPYIEADFHHRYVEVPLDHGSPEAGTFTLYYELSSNFDFKNPTVFYIVDSQQNAHGADKMAEQYQLRNSLNLVLIEYRSRKHSPIDMTKEDGSIDWEKAYRLTASHQAVEDIEAVRRDLFRDHPQTRINLYGRSGGAYLVHEYLSKYPTRAARAFTRTAPNPVIMHKLGNPESKSFVEGLDAIDPELHAKLKEVLARETVPSLELQWLLLQLPYRDPDALILSRPGSSTSCMAATRRPTTSTMPSGNTTYRGLTETAWCGTWVPGCFFGQSSATGRTCWARSRSTWIRSMRPCATSAHPT